MKRFRAVSLVVTTLILLSGCSSQSTSVPTLGAVVDCNSIPTSQTPTGLELPCLDGKSTIHFSDLRGPLIVNVWGSWCAPCQDEIPIIRSFYAKVQTKLHLMGVDVEEAKRSDGSDFVVANGMTWPNVVDPDGRSRGLFGMGVPVTWFINSGGVVVHKKIGVIKSEQELRDLTSQYLNITVG